MIHDFVHSLYNLLALFEFVPKLLDSLLELCDSRDNLVIQILQISVLAVLIQLLSDIIHFLTINFPNERGSQVFEFMIYDFH